MTILALDTSGPACSAAVLIDGKLAYEARAVNKLTHSRNLMGMVEEALQKSGSAPSDLSLISAVVGPGSFTGVRIGVAAAQGMARALGICCVPVNALEAMANSVLMPGVIICPMRDARAGQVYAAAFQNGQRLMADSALMLEDYLEQVSGFSGCLFFLGDGVSAKQDAIMQKLGSRAILAPAHLLLPGAGAAAVLAYDHQSDAVEPGNLKPVYLRAPQAERQRAMKNG